MKKIRAEDIALLSQEAPGFMRACQKVKEEKADFLVMSDRAFNPEKEAVLLKTCMRYAREQNVTLVFVPDR